MKYRYPPEFANLTASQIEQIDAWLDEFAYGIVQRKIQEEFSIRISENKLCRYNQHRELADDIEIETKFIYQLLNAERVPFDDAAIHVVEQRVFEHVLRRDLTVSKLVALHKLATYRQRLSLDQGRLALNEKRLRIPSPLAKTPPPDSATHSPRPPVLSAMTTDGSKARSTFSEPQPEATEAGAASPSPTLKPSPMSEAEWSTLLDQPPSVPPSSSSNPPQVVLPDVWSSLAQIMPPVTLDSKSALLTRQIPAETIPFPSVSSRRLPIAA